MSGGASHVLDTIQSLMSGPKTQRQLWDATTHSRSTISEHMRILRARKLIEFAGYAKTQRGVPPALWKWKTE